MKNKGIEKIVEWQHHMYDPGHYLGGNIHPSLLRRSKLAGITFFTFGTIGTILLIIAVAHKPLTIDDIAVFAPLLTTVLFLILGIQILRKKK